MIPGKKKPEHKAYNTAITLPQAILLVPTKQSSERRQVSYQQLNMATVVHFLSQNPWEAK